MKRSNVIRGDESHRRTALHVQSLLRVPPPDRERLWRAGAELRAALDAHQEARP